MKLHPLARCLAAALPCCAAAAVYAQSTPQQQDNSVTLETVTVEASADASAEGLSPAYAGGQVARGGRAGILGTRDNMDIPVVINSYTNQLIQDQQARSVGDVLQNDPSVRVSRGFGNFQESYSIRGFVLDSDDVAYNGLYSLLPRQYIATELFERVEVLHGASAFLTGAAPGGGGIGGVVNLVPKRAPNEPLTRITTGVGSGGQGLLSTDIARRFGPDDRMGIRINAATRTGETGIDDEHSRLSVGSLGLDWRGDRLRLSGDIGWQDNRLKRTRTNVDVGALSELPSAPDASSNWAQPWSYSNERDVFGTLRGEYDFTDNITGWAAYGMRNSHESNSLANIAVTNAGTGEGNFYRFDNTREDRVNTGELGLRAKTRTGPVGHEFVVSAAFFDLRKKNAYAMDFFNTFPTNLYDPVYYPKPGFSGAAFRGGDLDSPLVQGRVRTSSFAIGDTLSFAEDRVLLTLGIRHQRLETRNYDYNTGVLTDKYEDNRNSPVAGLVVKLSPQFSLYGNYIEALTQGELAPATASNPGTSLPPYVSRQKEVGLKYDGGNFGGNVAFFTTNRPRGAFNNDGTFSTSGENRHQGIELSMYGEPVRGFRLLGGLTWLDAKQRDTGAAGLDGKRVIAVSRFQGNLGAEWDVPGASGLTLDGRVVYTGAAYADDANTLRIPSWTRLDVGARYAMDVGGHVLTLRARVENLTNRDYWSAAGGTPAATAGAASPSYIVLGQPRTFWLSASMDF